MILQNLYNKVIGFFRQTDIKLEESAKETACNRLRVVLMQDRTNLTPELLERMRGELVELLSKYLEMDKEALELNLEQDGNQVALMLSIPVIRAKDEEEIKAALNTVDESDDPNEEDDDEEAKETDEIEETEELSEDDSSEDNNSPSEEEVKIPEDDISEKAKEKDKK